MRMIPGPSRPSAGRLVWWVVGCFLALVAAFWLTERTVDWLWMGTLGYRPVFWQIIDLRFALFAAAFIPLALYFSLNLRRTMQLMTAWRQATGAPLDPALAELERSSLLRRALAGLLALFLAIGFASVWDDAVRFLYGGQFGFVDPLLGRDVGFYVFRLPLIEAVRHGIFLVARPTARPGGARDRARRVPRLGAARRRSAHRDSICTRLELGRGRACFRRRLHTRSLQPALCRERHRRPPPDHTPRLLIGGSGSRRTRALACGPPQSVSAHAGDDPPCERQA